MRQIILRILPFAIFFTVGCSKDQATQTTSPNDQKEQPIVTTADQQAIFASRMANNEAIKAHDAVGVTNNYTEDFFVLTSTNSLISGKKEVGEVYQNVFQSQTEVIYVRTPSEIKVDAAWNMAAENGHWIGTWKVEEIPIKVRGTYHAKWHKIANEWKLRCEVYTQLDCQGAVICDKKPILSQ